ncbi:hypothetical protein [Haloferula sargassicola]|uniref:Uncharacterized protein n=1 Tax=Haloferula sargassicola TaxID=490096 RepID=A0ABP9UKH0_9BACT
MQLPDELSPVKVGVTWLVKATVDGLPDWVSLEWNGEVVELSVPVELYPGENPGVPVHRVRLTQEEVDSLLFVAERDRPYLVLPKGRFVRREDRNLDRA